MQPLNRISDSERIGLVRQIFSAITPKYDFLNRFLSMRRDIAWRRNTVGKMRFFRTHRFLDVATGTADLAIDAAVTYQNINVAGLDFVPEMIAVAGDKIRKKNLSDRITLVEGDAMKLPFDNGSFDVAAIAFGIRNIPDKVHALSEMARVVAPGGQIMVLELTTPRGRLTRMFYKLYLTRLLPLAGGLISGNSTAYRYLAASILDFPTPDEFSKLMEKAGLINVKKYPLTFGIAHLHVGDKATVNSHDTE